MINHQGLYRIELDNFETKIKDLSKSFSQNVGSVQIKMTKKQIQMSVMDEDDGSILDFLDVLETDPQRILKIITETGEVGYTMRFEGIKLTNHEMALGDAYEVQKTLASIGGQFGVTFNHAAIIHKLTFTFERVAKQ
jgi:hypothetical protein